MKTKPTKSGKKNKQISSGRIYKVTCPDKKYYIGSTRKKLKQRLKSHFRYKNTSLYNYCLKNNFDIKDLIIEELEKHATYKSAETKEYKILNKLKSDCNLLNKLFKKPTEKLTKKKESKVIRRKKQTLSSKSRLELDRVRAELES